jgi:hypothetical protein
MPCCVPDGNRPRPPAPPAEAFQQGFCRQDSSQRQSGMRSGRWGGAPLASAAEERGPGRSQDCAAARRSRAPGRQSHDPHPEPGGGQGARPGCGRPERTLSPSRGRRVPVDVANRPTMDGLAIADPNLSSPALGARADLCHSFRRDPVFRRPARSRSKAGRGPGPRRGPRRVGPPPAVTARWSPPGGWRSLQRRSGSPGVSPQRARQRSIAAPGVSPKERPPFRRVRRGHPPSPPFRIQREFHSKGREDSENEAFGSLDLPPSQSGPDGVAERYSGRRPPVLQPRMKSLRPRLEYAGDRCRLTSARIGSGNWAMGRTWPLSPETATARQLEA